MLLATRIVMFASIMITTTTVQAADVARHIALELDPVAPTAALLETNKGLPTSMFGGDVDFNLGHISTGPEFWVGAFTRKPIEGGGTAAKSENYKYSLEQNESVKLDAVRLRWNVALWESRYAMRGWFIRGGYSYTKIQSRARHTNNYGLAATEGGTPDPLLRADIIDLRQGLMAAFGQRWAIWSQSASITVSFSYNINLKRSVSVDSLDPDAEAKYQAIIEEIPDARLSARPMPEAHLSFGYLW